MKNKKVIFALVGIVLLLALVGCGEKNNEGEGLNQNPNESQNINVNQTENNNEDDENIAKPTILSIEKGYLEHKVKLDDGNKELLDYVSSYVILSEEDMIKYPKLAEAVGKDAEEIKNYANNEKTEMEQKAYNVYGNDNELFETFKLHKDVQVRRADSIVLSVLSDSYYDYFENKDIRILKGINYDSTNGNKLKLSDVINDVSKIPSLVARELGNSMWNTDLDLDEAVNDYFSKTSEENIAWTLDYNGVTIYFSNADLTDSKSEVQSATISFEENKDLFVKKYVNVPESYTVELGFENSFYSDLDDNDTLDELNLHAFYSNEKGMYETFGIYTNIDAVHFSKDVDAYNYRPFFIKNKENKLLYVFSETKETGFRDMKLTVVNVKDRNFEVVGEMNAGMGYMLSNLFALPTNPERIMLDNFERLEQDMMPYDVGEYGMPEFIDELESLDDEKIEVSSVEELIDAIKPNAQILIKPGYYNLSEYLEDAWKNEGDSWNENHEYLKITERFDGVDLTVENVNNLTISGGTVNSKDAHIEINPRYGTVLSFRNCENLTLANFMAGHTDTGTCLGNVLNLYSCKNVKLSNLDLYGCGDYGIGAFDQTEGISGTRITVRDCASGPLEFRSCKGNIEFYDCVFKDSEGFAIVEASTIIKFYDCEFGNKETTCFRYSGNFISENCIWDENAMYPEF